MITEEAIRERSYYIWQREGCPDGRSVEHWTRAKSELEAEAVTMSAPPDEGRRIVEARKVVAPRPSISRPPSRSMSSRVPVGHPTEVSAATQLAAAPMG
jgi:hypothetical protein